MPQPSHKYYNIIRLKKYIKHTSTQVLWNMKTSKFFAAKKNEMHVVYILYYTGVFLFEGTMRSQKKICWVVFVTLWSVKKHEMVQLIEFIMLMIKDRSMFMLKVIT